MLDLPEHLDVIRRAMVDGLEVQIEYRLKSGSVTRRWIRPLRLEGRPTNVHIRSICGFDGAEKSFLPAGILAILGTRSPASET
jgi:predicted DNA-binding transcriptional regulator YafY